MQGEAVGAMFDEFVQSGLLDDADVTVQTARFTKWNYDGKGPEALFLLLNCKPDNDDKVSAEYLSAGDLKFFTPSNDGRKAMPVGTHTKLNVNTNAAAFIISVINADTQGLLAAKIKTTDDISVLDGLRCHVKRVAVKGRDRFQIQNPEAGGQAAGQPARQQTQLQCDKIIAYPPSVGGAAVAQAAPVAQPQAAPAPAGGNGAAGPSSAVADTATGILISILAEAGGSVKQGALAGKVFSSPAASSLSVPERNQVLALIVRPDFLAKPGSPWKFDATSGAVSLG